MYEGTYLDLKWQRSIVVPNVDINLRDGTLWLKFSKDGSKLLMYVPYSCVIAIFNANNGSVSAATTNF
jgi:hypothetical protein